MEAWLRDPMQSPCPGPGVLVFVQVNTPITTVLVWQVLLEVHRGRDSKEFSRCQAESELDLGGVGCGSGKSPASWRHSPVSGCP
jgi:hypothetical protein